MEEYETLADEIRESIREEYFTSTGGLALKIKQHILLHFIWI